MPALVGRHLPQLTAPALVAGVAGLSPGPPRRWHDCGRWPPLLDGEQDNALPAAEQTPAGARAVARLLAEGLAGLIQYCYAAGDLPCG